MSALLCVQDLLPATLLCSYHDNDVIMGAIGSQFTSLTIVYSTVYADKWNKASKLLITGLCAGIHRWPVNSPHKWPVTRKIFPIDDVIMSSVIHNLAACHFLRNNLTIQAKILLSKLKWFCIDKTWIKFTEPCWRIYVSEIKKYTQTSHFLLSKHICKCRRLKQYPFCISHNESSGWPCMLRHVFYSRQSRALAI